MAHIEEQGGKTSSVVELNLVPFIDLMSVCIIFLLITAVWTQVSMLQLGSSVYSQQTDADPAPPPPFAEVILRVDVLPEGFRLNVGKDQLSIPMAEGGYDKALLLQKLKEAKSRYPEKVDGIASVRDNVKYKHLVAAMDALIVAGFPQVSITTTGVE